MTTQALIDNFSEIFAIVLSVGTFTGGIVAWHRARVQKSYAAERDFNHLRNTFAQLEKNILVLADNQEESLKDVERQLIEIKGLVNTLLFSLRGTTTEGFYLQERDKHPH